MDTTKSLLAITAALLLGALLYNWQTVQKEAQSAPMDEISRLKRQIEEMRLEEYKLLTEKKLRQESSFDAHPRPEEVKTLEEKLQKAEADKEALAQEKERARNEAELARQETNAFAQRQPDNADKSQRRMRQVKDALLMGKVLEFVNDPTIGSFVSIEPLLPEHIHANTILGIRRSGEIIGQVKVRSIESDGAIADLMPSATPFTPLVGDELIIPPN